MDLKEILFQKEFHYHRINSLILIVLGAFTFSLTILLPWIRQYHKSFLLEFGIVFIVLSFFILHWQWYRSNFPKGRGQKPLIVLAIATENLKQKTRIQKDLKEQIDKRIDEFQLSNLITTKVIHNHLSESIYDKIRKARDYGLLSSNNPIWNRIGQIMDKMNAQVLIYGDLKERDSPNSAYYLNIDSIISHDPIKLPVSQVIANIMKEVWRKEIKVLINDEFDGFKTTGDHISFAASFMTALSAFANMQFEKSISILDQLSSTNSNLDLSSYTDTIIRLKATCYQLGAVLAHHQGDHDKSNRFQKERDKLIPNPYNKFLSEATVQEKKGNSQLAMSLIDKSVSYSNGDGTWRYSKLYLNIRLKRFKEAISVLNAIEERSFPGERTAIETVISYNRNALQEDEGHIQTHFIIGFLLLKKQKKLPCFIRGVYCIY